MSELYLIRHGQASINTDNYDRLSPLGQEQAAILGRYLAELGVGFDAAYSGTMQRQRHTGQLVLEGLGHDPGALVPQPAGDEYNAFAIFKTQLARIKGVEHLHDQEVRDLAQDRQSFRALYERAMLNWLDAGPQEAGPETWLGFQERVAGWIRGVMAMEGRGKRVALFTSGGPISAAMRLALGLSDEVALRLTWQVRNASVTVLRYNERSLSLECFNSVAHLQATRRPELVTLV
ncbi:MAG: histidine phosphatase family protein [Desulfarculus sp.]|nr:histidine phosphatase family protein [Desulfarculus sp.]